MTIVLVATSWCVSNIALVYLLSRAGRSRRS
jgi:hypothetical protein